MHSIERIDYPAHNYTEFVCGASHMIATLIEGDRQRPWLLIDDLEVRPVHRRRQGIGTALVSESIPLAQELDVIRILAVIVSRESLVVMTKVFGPDAVRVDDVGDFGLAQGNTSALLDYAF